MSHYIVKTTYKTEGAWGETEDNTLYALHNNTCDIVSYYDDNGRFIMAVPDTIDTNIVDAINLLYSPRNVFNEYKSGVIPVSIQEFYEIEHKQDGI